MAEIYDVHGNCYTCGLQSQSICDEAMRAATEIAGEQGKDVYLEDGDDRYTVRPDGRVDYGWPNDTEE